MYKSSVSYYVQDKHTVLNWNTYSYRWKYRNQYYYCNTVTGNYCPFTVFPCKQPARFVPYSVLAFLVLLSVYWFYEMVFKQLFSWVQVMSIHVLQFCFLIVRTKVKCEYFYFSTFSSRISYASSQSSVRVMCSVRFVHVSAKPVISNEKADFVINEGTELELPCKATGKPQPSVSWEKDGRAMLLNTNQYMIQVSISLYTM